MTGDLPLRGCKVVDLSRALSGPFCTMILGDLGADVVKVEPYEDGDMIRTWGPFAEGESIYFLSANRNKRSLAVNLRSKEGLDLIRELVRYADVFVENFKVGTTAAMGLDYETLVKINPRLVYCSITGFGRGGPYERHPGFDQVAQGLSGLMSVNGNGDTQYRVGIPIADLTTGMWSAIGVMAAVMRQREHGVGQLVETSLLTGIMSLLSFQGQKYLTLGEVSAAAGNDHPLLAPYGVFEARDGAMNLAVATDTIWARLCNALDMNELRDAPEYRDNTQRRNNLAALKEAIEMRLRERDRAEWLEILTAADIPAGPIQSVGEALTDPHVVATRFVQSVAHPTLGEVKQMSSPIQFGDGPQEIRLPPPLLGEHSVEILEAAGIDAQRIQHLVSSGFVRDGRPHHSDLAAAG